MITKFATFLTIMNSENLRTSLQKRHVNRITWHSLDSQFQVCRCYFVANTNLLQFPENSGTDLTKI